MNERFEHALLRSGIVEEFVEFGRHESGIRDQRQANGCLGYGALCVCRPLLDALCNSYGAG